MVEVLQLLPPRCPVGSLVASLAPVPVMGFLRLWGSTSAPEQWESWGNCFKIKGEEVGLTSSFDGHFGLRVYFLLVGFPRFSWFWKNNPSMPAMETQHFGWLVFSLEFRVSEAVCFPKPTTNTCLTKWGPTVSVVAKPTVFFAYRKHRWSLKCKLLIQQNCFWIVMVLKTQRRKNRNKQFRQPKNGHSIIDTKLPSNVKMLQRKQHDHVWVDPELQIRSKLQANGIGSASSTVCRCINDFWDGLVP